MSNSPAILLAEDDLQYAFIIQLALKQAGIDNPVRLVTTRAQVIDYMSGAGAYADRIAHPLPILILLALRLPLLEGFNSLRWVRQHPEFNPVRIVVLSGVEYGDERATAHELGADCYHVKPADYAGLVLIAQGIRERWLGTGEHQAAA